MTVYWYNLYSFWTLIMCILSYLHLISFSVIPSVIGSIIGTSWFILMQLRTGKPMSFTFMAIKIILHLFPFLILPIQFTRQDVLINISVFFMFNMWLLSQGVTFMSVYRDIINEDGRLTLYDYAKRRGFLQFL